MIRVRSLALNPDGFAFDPTTGESYTVNPTGLLVLQGLRDQRTAEDIVAELMERFGVTQEEASRDIDDFLDTLRVLRLV